MEYSGGVHELTRLPSIAIEMSTAVTLRVRLCVAAAAAAGALASYDNDEDVVTLGALQPPRDTQEHISGSESIGRRKGVKVSLETDSPEEELVARLLKDMLSSDISTSSSTEGVHEADDGEHPAGEQIGGSTYSQDGEEEGQQPAALEREKEQKVLTLAMSSSELGPLGAEGDSLQSYGGRASAREHAESIAATVDVAVETATAGGDSDVRNAEITEFSALEGGVEQPESVTGDVTEPGDGTLTREDDVSCAESEDVGNAAVNVPLDARRLDEGDSAQTIQDAAQTTTVMLGAGPEMVTRPVEGAAMSGESGDVLIVVDGHGEDFATVAGEASPGAGEASDNVFGDAVGEELTGKRSRVAENAALSVDGTAAPTSTLASDASEEFDAYVPAMEAGAVAKAGELVPSNCDHGDDETREAGGKNSDRSTEQPSGTAAAEATGGSVKRHAPGHVYEVSVTSDHAIVDDVNDAEVLAREEEQHDDEAGVDPPSIDQAEWHGVGERRGLASKQPSRDPAKSGSRSDFVLSVESGIAAAAAETNEDDQRPSGTATAPPGSATEPTENDAPLRHRAYDDASPDGALSEARPPIPTGSEALQADPGGSGRLGRGARPEAGGEVPPSHIRPAFRFTNVRQEIDVSGGDLGGIPKAFPSGVGGGSPKGLPPDLGDLSKGLPADLATEFALPPLPPIDMGSTAFQEAGREGDSRALIADEGTGWLAAWAEKWAIMAREAAMRCVKKAREKGGALAEESLKVCKAWLVKTWHEVLEPRTERAQRRLEDEVLRAWGKVGEHLADPALAEAL